MKHNKDIGLLIIRIGIGLMFIFVHGGPKLLGGPDKWEKVGSAMSYFGIDYIFAFWGFIAALAEFGGGILLLLGRFFRLACALLLITMIVAATQHLLKSDGIIKASQAIELGILFIALLFTGSGIYRVYLKKPLNVESDMH